MTKQKKDKKFSATAEENNKLIQSLQNLEKRRNKYNRDKDYSSEDPSDSDYKKSDHAERMKKMMKKLKKMKKDG